MVDRQLAEVLEELAEAWAAEDAQKVDVLADRDLPELLGSLGQHREADSADDVLLGLAGGGRPGPRRQPCSRRTGWHRARAAACLRADSRRRDGRVGIPPRPTIDSYPRRPAPSPQSCPGQRAAFRREHRGAGRRSGARGGGLSGRRPAGADARDLAAPGHRTCAWTEPRHHRKCCRTPRPCPRPTGGSHEVRLLHHRTTRCSWVRRPPRPATTPWPP